MTTTPAVRWLLAAGPLIGECVTTVTRKLTVNKAHPAVRLDVPAAILQGSTLTAAQISPAPYALYGVQGSFDHSNRPATTGTARQRP